MTYCDVSLVRTVSGLENEVRDERVRNIRDDIAIPRINDDIQTRVEKEHVTEITGAKLNDTNGDNKTFYLREVHNSFRQLGDLDDDGEVTTDDIKAWAVIDRDERKDVKINAILDKSEGKFTAVLKDDNSPLPEDAELYVRYRHAPVNVAKPNSMVSIACAQLTAAFCFSNIETPKLKNFSIGDVEIRNQTEGFGIMKDQYTESMRRIVNRELIEFDENENEIEDVIKRDFAGDNPLGRGKRTTTGRFRSG